MQAATHRHATHAERTSRVSVESLPAPCAEIAPSGTLIAVNAAWRGLMDTSGAIPGVGEPVEALGDCADVALRSALASGVSAIQDRMSPRYTTELCLDHNGELRFLRVILAAYERSGNRRVFVRLHDVTTRKIAEYQELLEAAYADACLRAEDEVDVLRYFAEVWGAALQADASSLWLQEGDAQTSRLASVWRLNGCAGNDLGLPRVSHRLSHGMLASEVVASRQAHWQPVVSRQDQALLRSELSASDDLQRGFALPLILRNGQRGVLCLYGDSLSRVHSQTARTAMSLLGCSSPQSSTPAVGSQSGSAADTSLAAQEHMHIERVLKETGYNIRKTSQLLAISRSTLYQKIRRYEIFVPTERRQAKQALASGMRLKKPA